MTQERSSGDEIDLDPILNALSSDFEALRNELYKELRQEVRIFSFIFIVLKNVLTLSFILFILKYPVAL